jgi:redox-sensitive bicupin YhaK (pirin superfamily)
MTAGSGIVHSERTPPEERVRGPRMHGMQIWVGLPAAQEEIAPSFAHYAAASLPRLEVPGATISVIIGHAYGAQSPVATLSPTLYCALELEAGAQVPVDAEHEERALYVASGAIEIGGTRVETGWLAVLTPGVPVQIDARAEAKVMLLGGAPIGPRFMWWNFVSSRKERIEQAKADWAAQRIGKVPGETEFIPLPQK